MAQPELIIVRTDERILSLKVDVIPQQHQRAASKVRD
jgi:hypothetical protein